MTLTERLGRRRFVPNPSVEPLCHLVGGAGVSRCDHLNAPVVVDILAVDDVAWYW
jgi:hypothetical protein